MKKRLLSTALTALMLVSCAKGGNENSANGDGSVWDTTIGDNIELGVFEHSTDKEHVIIEPEAEGYYTMKLKSKGSVSSKEDVETFKKYFDMLLPNRLTDEEYDDEFRFIVEEIPALADTNIPYPHNYPKVSDYRSELDSDKYASPYLTIDTPELELTVNIGGLYILQRGKTYALEDDTRSISIYLPDKNHEKSADYLDPSNNDTYQLADKSLSVKDAAETAEKYLDEIFSTENTDFKPYVSEVAAIKLGDRYGYSFRVTKSYKGIPFDYLYSKTAGGVGYRYISNGKTYDNFPAYAFMNDSTELDIIIGYNPRYSIEELEKVDRILSREESLSILSKTYSHYVKLNVFKEELVYTAEYANENGTEQIVRPAWKFSLMTGNKIVHYAYVDAVTGDCWYIEADPSDVS